MWESSRGPQKEPATATEMTNANANAPETWDSIKEISPETGRRWSPQEEPALASKKQGLGEPLKKLHNHKV
jgi:hypothetical protein